MIHAYKNNGYNIVLDVNSGSVHVVDDVVFDLVSFVEDKLSGKYGSAAAADDEQEVKKEDLEWLSKEALSLDGVSDKYSQEEINEAVEELLELRAAQVLYTDDVYENYVDDFQNRETVVKALCLNIAHDCNLRCKYCFADEGEYHGRRALMSEEVGKKALDFLMETGLVLREQVGNAYHYNLNSKHFLYEPITTLFKEEEKTINKIMKCGAAFIEEFAQ